MCTLFIDKIINKIINKILTAPVLTFNLLCCLVLQKRYLQIIYNWELNLFQVNKILGS